jgi:hypothetical protein
MANPHFQNLILWAGNTVATEHKKNQPMFAPYPSDQTFYMYHNDFFTYNSGGSASEAVTSSAGGALLLTNAAGDNDLDFLQLKGEGFKLSTSKKAYFSARFKVNDVDQSDFVMGLGITDTTPLDTTDGVFFISADGDAGLDFLVEKDNTATTTEDVATMADDTFITTTWFIDPDASKVFYSVDNAAPVGVVNTNLPDDEELTVSFGIQNGEASAQTMTIDYVVAAVER